MFANRPKKLGVSFSWREEREGQCKGAVDRFCDELRKSGVEVVRDKDELQKGESIRQFMQSLGASDFLCVFLSDAYLKSPNCMYELKIAWERSKDNPVEFRQRVKVWVMPDASGIRDQETRLNRYCAHWRAEVLRLKPIAKEAVEETLSPTSLEELRNFQELVQHTDAILAFVADNLSAGSEEEFLAWVRGHFPGCLPQSDSATLKDLYRNTVSEIEGVIRRSSQLGSFLNQTIPELLVLSPPSGWKLSEAFLSRRFKLPELLERLVCGLAEFNGSRDDWEALGEVSGALVVLGVNPEWVLAHRASARSFGASFPGHDNTIHLGKDRQASLLHLVTAALSDGVVRLDRIFGKPAVDPKVMPDFSDVMRSISPEDQALEMKVHIIRTVLGPDVRINPADTKRLDIQFDEAREEISFAFHHEHQGYVASGPNFRQLSRRIREELKVEDLLLISPSGDHPDGLLVHHFKVLRFLALISEQIQDRTGR